MTTVAVAPLPTEVTRNPLAYLRAQNRTFRALGNRIRELELRTLASAERARKIGARAIERAYLADRATLAADRLAHRQLVDRLNGLNEALRAAQMPELGAIPLAVAGYGGLVLATLAAGVYAINRRYAAIRGAQRIRERELALAESGRLTGEQYARAAEADAPGDPSSEPSLVRQIALPLALGAGALVLFNQFAGRVLSGR